MRNTIFSVLALAIAVILAGYTLIVNPPEFLHKYVTSHKATGSTYSFATRMSSGNLYVDKRGLSYAECQTMLNDLNLQRLSTGISAGLNNVCVPENGSELTYSQAFFRSETGRYEPLISGLSYSDCQSGIAEWNEAAARSADKSVAPSICVPD